MEENSNAVLLEPNNIGYVKPACEFYAMELEGIIAQSGNARTENYNDGGEISYLSEPHSLNPHSDAFSSIS